MIQGMVTAGSVRGMQYPYSAPDLVPMQTERDALAAPMAEELKKELGRRGQENRRGIEPLPGVREIGMGQSAPGINLPTFQPGAEQLGDPRLNVPQGYAPRMNTDQQQHDIFTRSLDPAFGMSAIPLLPPEFLGGTPPSPDSVPPMQRGAAVDPIFLRLLAALG